MPGGRRLAAAVAVLAVFCVLGAFAPAVQASAFAVSTWTKQAPASHPTARYDTDSTYDAASGSVVLFGGIGNNGVPGDTWTWGPSM